MRGETKTQTVGSTRSPPLSPRLQDTPYRLQLQRKDAPACREGVGTGALREGPRRARAGEDQEATAFSLPAAAPVGTLPRLLLSPPQPEASDSPPLPAPQQQPVSFMNPVSFTKPRTCLGISPRSLSWAEPPGPPGPPDGRQSSCEGYTKSQVLIARTVVQGPPPQARV